MGTVLRKAYTMPLPPRAELFDRDGVRMARWRLRNGKVRTAEVANTGSGDVRVRGQSAYYMARFRDGNGNVVEIGTGCRDETAARQVLANLVRRSERVRAGLLTPAEDAAIDHRAVSLDRHCNSYLSYLRDKRIGGRKVSAHHCRNVKHNLKRMLRECRFERIQHINRQPVERWLAARENEGMSARTRNAHLAALVAFCNWCVQTNRMVASPLNRMAKANEKADPRRQRRALTEAELVRLLDAARRRPLVEAMTVRRGSRRGQAVGCVRPETRERLEQLGHERALIYKTLVLTGLRKGELASLTVGQLVLDPEDGRIAYVVLKPQDEKNGRGSEIPLRIDLAADLRRWLALRLEQARDSARQRGEPTPTRLSPEAPLLNVPDGLIRIFDLDLVAAGLARRVRKNGKWIIEKRDDRGRTIDVHALRHTFGTHLSRGGVAPRTAQAAMRHSTLELTMNTYTDPRLLDVAGALEVLPALPLDADGAEGASRAVAEVAARACVGAPPIDVLGDRQESASRADGVSHLAPNLALTGDRSGPRLALGGNAAGVETVHAGASDSRASDARGKSRACAATVVNRSQKQRATRLERATFSLEG